MNLNYSILTKKLSQIKKYLNNNDLYHYKSIDNLDVEYTYHSNAIEGNTLSLQETSFVLEGLSVANKDMRELYEVKNHSKAFRYIFDNKDNKKIIDNSDILKIHSMILNNIDDYNAGVYRQRNVGIVGTNIVFPYPIEIPSKMQEFNDWLKKEQTSGIMHPIAFASKAHFDLVNIHPFIDGNGRTCRLLMNMILLQNSYPPLIIKVEDKIDYIKALNSSRDNKNNDFEKFIYKKVEATLNNYINQSLEIKKLSNKNNER